MSPPKKSNSVRRETLALFARIVVVILPLHAAVVVLAA